MSPWRSAVLGLISAVTSAVATYWQTAPALLHTATYWLGPVLVVDALSAVWMQHVARDHAAHPRDDDPQITVYEGDNWLRAGARLGLTLGLVCMAGAVDSITGSRHMTVLWVLLWGVSGHGRAAVRHFQIIAQYNHFTLPIFPTEKLDQVSNLKPVITAPSKPAEPAHE